MMRNYLRRAYRSLLPFLYARTNFKLFLKVAIADLAPQTRQLAIATDFFSPVLRPIPIRAPFGKSMLVVAPHQDDEVIGCGGALIQQLRSGGKAHIVLLQDGADNHDELGMTRAQMTAMRNAESTQVTQLLAIEPPSFFNFASLSQSASEAAARLSRIIIDRRVDAVFSPFPLDGHLDHRIASSIVADAFREIPWDVRVFGYEVWGSCPPNVLVIIDDVMDRKIELLRCFDFANKAIDYVHATTGRNMYHSRLLGAGECRYAECFFECPKREYIAIIDHLRTTASAG